MSLNTLSPTNDPLTKIQNWYQSQCDGEWEHSFGIRIQNIDNPGWQVQIDVSNTELENIAFSEVRYGFAEETDDLVGNEFNGHGGPHKLAEILETFLKWARENQAVRKTESDH